MTKEEFKKKIDAIPDEVLEKCYVVDLLNNHLQLNFSSEIINKYFTGGEVKIGDSTGYLEFFLNFQDFDFEITMT